MPRKAGQNGKKTPEMDLSQVTDAEGFYCIKGELFWKYKAHQAEFDASQHKLTVVKQRIRMLIDLNPELKSLYEEQNELVKIGSITMRELTEVNEQIEKMLGVPLKNCGIDDKTGRVHILEPDGTLTPKAPEKAAKKSNRRMAGAA
jgi:hypothetical protein